MRRRSAFTLIEILVVVGIVAVLVALTVMSVSLLNRMRAQATTSRLLDNVVFSMTKYLDANPVFAPAALADFNASPSRPWKYLGVGSNRLLELSAKSLGTATGAGVTSIQDAETILDGWGTPLVFRITQGPTINGRTVPARIEIASRGRTTQTPYPDADDLIWRYDADGSPGLTGDDARFVGRFWRKQ